MEAITQGLANRFKMFTRKSGLKERSPLQIEDCILQGYGCR
jgi:hypothetical protein